MRARDHQEIFCAASNVQMTSLLALVSPKAVPLVVWNTYFVLLENFASVVAKGNTDPEVLEHARQHALEVHGMRIDLELERRVLGLIRDEESDAHRQGMGGLIP